MNRRVVAAGVIWLLLLGLAGSLKAAGAWRKSECRVSNVEVFSPHLRAFDTRISAFALTTIARPERLFFESGGRKIRADRYSPVGTRSHRAVIVLYGAGGMVFDGPSMRRVARTLAEAGDTVYLLHYYNRTGTIVALDSTMQRHFAEWLETLRDGIVWVHGREKKDSIGLYGYSLGGFLAIAAASDNPLVGAVTEQAGGIWNSQEKRVGKMPQVLMVHGLEDKRVPVDKYAKPLLRVLRERSGHVETAFVPNEGHVFSEAAMAVARPKIAKFFARLR